MKEMKDAIDHAKDRQDEVRMYMPVIRVKQNFIGRRTMVSSMYGYEGPILTPEGAKVGRFIHPPSTVHAGFCVDVLPDGYAEIPDTLRNRKILRGQLKPWMGKQLRTMVENGKVVRELKEVMFPPIFELLDEVDLTQPPAGVIAGSDASKLLAKDEEIAALTVQLEREKKAEEDGKPVSPGEALSSANAEQAATNTEKPARKRGRRAIKPD